MRLAPWYSRQKRYVPVVVTVLFVALMTTRFVVKGDDGISFLYVFPVSLLAMAYGLRGGLVGGVTGFGLFAIAETIAGDDLNAASWVTRAVTLLLVGLLLGRATDQVRGEARLRRRFEQDGKEALELNNSLIQNMAAAKWLAEQQRNEQTVDVLHSAIAENERLVSRLFRRHSTAAVERRTARRRRKIEKVDARLPLPGGPREGEVAE